MQKIWTYLFLSFPVLGHSQQDLTLPGRVVEQNSQYRTGKVQYLEGAFILATGAAPTRSDAGGNFTLVFADKPAGNSAKVTVKKSGYKVVNERELENAAIIGRLSPLKVVLCNESRLRENQLAYYQIAEDIAAKEKERRLALLEKDIKTKASTIAGLEKELNRKILNEQQALAALEELQLIQQIRGEEMADRLLLVNLDDASGAFRRAYDAFLQRDLSKAIAILDSIDSETRLGNLGKALAEDRAALEILTTSIAKKEEQKAQELEQVVFKARLLGLQLDFADAEKTYSLALQHDSVNVELLWELAEFNANINRFDEAIAYCQKALARPASDRQKAGLYNILGVMFLKKQDLEKGGQALKNALEVQQRLVLEDSITHAPELAHILENLGHTAFQTQQFKTAGGYYERALLIWKNLLETNPKVAYPQAAATLNHLGLVYKSYGQYPQADTLLRQSLHIYRQLEKSSPGAYDADLATTLHNLGVMYGEWSSPSAAETWLNEALAIRRKLAANNPGAYLPDLANTLQAFGLLYINFGDYQNAETQLKEALGFFEKLEQQSPGAYLPDLANTLNILGVAYNKTGRYDLALETFTRTLNFRKSLANQNPAANETDLWTTYLNLVVLFKDQLLETKDLTFRQKGLAILSELEQRMEQYRQFADLTPMVERILKDVDYFEGFFEKAATVAGVKIAAALEKANELENAALRKSSPETAIATLENAVSMMDAALLEFPGNAELKTRQAQLCGGLATMYLFNGKFAKAAATADKGLQTDGKEAWINLPLAPALLFIGESERALSIFRFWKDVFYHGEQTFKDVFLRNLDELEQKGYTHPDMAKVRVLLKG